MKKYIVGLLWLCCTHCVWAEDHVGWYLFAGGSVYGNDEFARYEYPTGFRFAGGIQLSNRFGLEVVLDNPYWKVDYFGVYSSFVGTFTQPIDEARSLVLKYGRRGDYVERDAPRAKTGTGYRIQVDDVPNNIVSVGLSVDWRRKFKIEFSVEKSFIDEFFGTPKISVYGRVRYQF